MIPRPSPPPFDTPKTVYRLQLNGAPRVLFLVSQEVQNLYISVNLTPSGYAAGKFFVEDAENFRDILAALGIDFVIVKA